MTGVRLAIFLLFTALIPAAQADAGPAGKYDALLEGSKDEILRRAFVPSPDRRQGEVRLVRRGNAAVMQTVLSTAILRRVVGEIRKKELSSWPPERPGHADALRYIAALRQAGEEIQARSRKRKERGDRRQALAIEFILSEDASIVAFYEPALEETEEGFGIASKRLISILELSRAYVRGDIYEIAWDALKIKKEESAMVLDPLVPEEAE
jgi:hypothetical protein